MAKWFPTPEEIERVKTERAEETERERAAHEAFMDSLPSISMSEALRELGYAEST